MDNKIRTIFFLGSVILLLLIGAFTVWATLFSNLSDEELISIFVLIGLLFVFWFKTLKLF